MLLDFRICCLIPLVSLLIGGERKEETRVFLSLTILVIPCVNVSQCTCNCTNSFDASPPVCPPLPANTSAPSTPAIACSASANATSVRGCVQKFSKCDNCSCAINGSACNSGNQYQKKKKKKKKAVLRKEI
jgi:hypothetical protein